MSISPRSSPTLPPVATPPRRKSPNREEIHAPRPSYSSSLSSSFLSSPVASAFTGFYRRLTEPLSPPLSGPSKPMFFHSNSSSGGGGGGGGSGSGELDAGSKIGIIHTPTRTESPFAPPPLTALALVGAQNPAARILGRALAEEIRLLLPPRLQLATDWSLIYSVDQHGVSLATLYDRCERFKGSRHGFILVVKDALGGTFGAFLTDPPHPSSHYYGTGECFLWRATILPASILASLPPPPSADTTNLQRSTTIAPSDDIPGPQPTKSPFSPGLSPRYGSRSPHRAKSPLRNGSGGEGKSRTPDVGTTTTSSATSTGSETDRLRFKAFPYSGINDYMIFCEQDYLSIGGGDGKYGLWLDSVLEQGVSSPCLTFGNEHLSEEGEKFEAIGVEIWAIGA